MEPKKLSVKTVLLLGAVTGISVILIAYFAILMQERRTVKASREGTLPTSRQLDNLAYYTTDHEGVHHYALDRQADVSKGSLRAWSRLIYTSEGRNTYIERRRQRNIFVEGFDKLSRRDILYEFQCAKDPMEYAIIEVFEVDDAGKTLDYGRTGSSKDWEAIPPETTIDRLARVVCPAAKK